MSKHHDHSSHGHHGQQRPPKQGVHRKWWFWVAVVLMLAAMFLYVGTLDEALQPGGEVGPPVPAAE